MHAGGGGGVMQDSWSFFTQDCQHRDCQRVPQPGVSGRQLPGPRSLLKETPDESAGMACMAYIEAYTCHAPWSRQAEVARL